MAEEAKKINLRQSPDIPLTLKAEDIPNLAPKEALDEWMKGDEEPYYKIQQIDYPLMANGYNYLESFFESFVKKLERAPIPGSKAGHEMSWGKRSPTDLLLVGAKFEKKGNGTGSVFFKNYIPPAGESGDNSVFIKENRTGMIDFSLVSYTKDEREELPDGGVRWNVIESMYGERNDAVGYGEGAMEQKTNSREAEKENDMSKKAETLATLKTLKQNAEVTLLEVAEAMGLRDQIVTDDQKMNLSSYGKVKALCGETDPVQFIEGILEERKANAEKVRMAAISEAFGPEVHAETGKTNKARAYADKIIGDEELTEEKINEIKEDEIFKALAAEIADVDSDYNKVGGVEKKENVVAIDKPYRAEY